MAAGISALKRTIILVKANVFLYWFTLIEVDIIAVTLTIWDLLEQMSYDMQKRKRDFGMFNSQNVYKLCVGYFHFNAKATFANPILLLLI